MNNNVTNDKICFAAISISINVPHFILFQTWLTIAIAKRIRIEQKEIQNVQRKRTAYTLDADQRHYKYVFVKYMEYSLSRVDLDVVSRVYHIILAT